MVALPGLILVIIQADKVLALSFPPTRSSGDRSSDPCRSMWRAAANLPARAHMPFLTTSFNPNLPSKRRSQSGPHGQNCWQADKERVCFLWFITKDYEFCP